MKIGILGCGYNCADNLIGVLNPWFNSPNYKDMVISVVSCKFREYDDLNIKSDNLPTEKVLRMFKDAGAIQYLEIPNKSLLEHEARNLALKHLIDEECDIIWLLDLSDEFYTEKDIAKILDYIEKDDNKFYNWFSIPFKNYLFSGKEWIAGFHPPRIFRTNIGHGQLKLDLMNWDNDFLYKTDSGGTIDYRQLPNKVIPSNILNGGVKHMTWLHSNGESKEKYQRAHFKNICSYKFNKEKNELEFDIDGYYKKFNIPIPEIHKDE